MRYSIKKDCGCCGCRSWDGDGGCRRSRRQPRPSFMAAVAAFMAAAAASTAAGFGGGGFRGGGWGGGGWRGGGGWGRPGWGGGGWGYRACRLGRGLGWRLGWWVLELRLGLGRRLGLESRMGHRRRDRPSRRRVRFAVGLWRRRSGLLGQAARLDGERPLYGSATRECMLLTVRRAGWFEITKN